LTQPKDKQYELINHLGNVLNTVSDEYPVNNEAVLLSSGNYYPFGAPITGCAYTDGEYRFGFNGKENDNEVKGIGTQQDYGMRIYDPRLGKFLSVDPLASEFAWNSPYSYAENGPISATDLDGGESKVIIYRETDKEPVLVKTINIPPHLRTQGDGIATVYVNTTNKTAEGDYREFSTQGSISYTTMVKQFKIGQPARAIAQAQKEAVPPVTTGSSSGGSERFKNEEGFIQDGGNDGGNTGSDLPWSNQDGSQGQGQKMFYGTASILGGILSLGTTTSIQAAVIGSLAIANGTDDVLSNNDGISLSQTISSDATVNSNIGKAKTAATVATMVVGGFSAFKGVGGASMRAVNVGATLNDANSIKETFTSPTPPK